MSSLADNLPATAARQDTGNSALAALAGPVLPATTEALSGAIADTNLHLIGPFSPQLSRPICLTVNATTLTSGTVQLLRSIDGGATTLALTVFGDVYGKFGPYSNAMGALVNEAVWTETSALATFYLAIALTAGSVTYNLHQ